MGTYDIRPLLAALLGHTNRHPHLATTLLGISGYQSFTFQVRGTLANVAAWVSTFSDVQPLKVIGDPNDRLGITVTLTGVLCDGTKVDLQAVLSHEETDLLAANTRVQDGDTIPVELLLQLVDQADAESVPR